MKVQEELTSALIDKMCANEASWAIDAQISQMSANMLDPASIWIKGEFIGIGK